MKVGDYFQHRKRWWLRLHEKGGNRNEVLSHPSLEQYELSNATASIVSSRC
jgi:hypothetical protein